MTKPTKEVKELLAKAAEDFRKHQENTAQAKMNAESVKILKNDIPIPQDGKPLA